MAESNTWEGRENLENAQKAIEEFEKEYWQNKNKKRGYLKGKNCQENS